MNGTLVVLDEIYTMAFLWGIIALPVFFNQNTRGNK